ncbi:uncharacterized protein LOC107271981 [Cephus cinctus]|uniref:Uncharacterized protein LOC107271981 n=1 Tax=Cephus cinctus TaxID=211228 RepID=A0AAJ7C7X9_CEPCN|nr:uncharacterized protein LOC107271981 [Cephus cinctus]
MASLSLTTKGNDQQGESQPRYQTPFRRICVSRFPFRFTQRLSGLVVPQLSRTLNNQEAPRLCATMHQRTLKDYAARTIRIYTSILNETMRDRHPKRCEFKILILRIPEVQIKYSSRRTTTAVTETTVEK